MMTDLFRHITQFFDRMQDRRAYYRMLFYLFEFFRRQGPVFIQYMVGDAYLAYVMQKRRYLQRLSEIPVLGYFRYTFQLPGDSQTIGRHALCVAVRIRIPRVYSRGERYGGVNEYPVLADV